MLPTASPLERMPVAGLNESLRQILGTDKTLVAKSKSGPKPPKARTQNAQRPRLARPEPDAEEIAPCPWKRSTGFMHVTFFDRATR